MNNLFLKMIFLGFCLIGSSAYATGSVIWLGDEGVKGNTFELYCLDQDFIESIKLNPVLKDAKVARVGYASCGDAFTFAFIGGAALHVTPGMGCSLLSYPTN